MALKDLKSLYDRHNKNELGNSVAGDGSGPIPSDGTYYSNNMTSDSPFDSVRGLKMDQMVQMLKDPTTSVNSGLTYQPSPHNVGGFQDLDGGFPVANPTLGQFGGPYIDNLPG